MENLKDTTNPQFCCYGCTFACNSARALSSHWQKYKKCAEISYSYPNNFREDANAINDVKNLQAENDDVTSSPLSINFENDIDGDDEKNSINNQMQEQSNANFSSFDDRNVAPKIELLKMLNTAKAPLYLYDNIMSWAKNLSINMMLILALKKTHHVKNL